MTYGQNGGPGKQNRYMEKSEKEQKQMPTLYSFVKGGSFIYNKTIYMFRKYMKQVFVSYINKCLSNC